MQAYQQNLADVTFGRELPREMKPPLSRPFSEMKENKETSECSDDDASDPTLPLSGQCYLKDKRMYFKEYIISIEDCATVVLKRPHSSKQQQLRYPLSSV